MLLHAAAGRVIGKNGETVKALQVFTGASIQIDQVSEPARIIMSGTPQALQLAASMVMDIINGTFRGFSLLRQLAQSDSRQPGQPPLASQMVYAPGYGLIPATEVSSSLLCSSHLPMHLH
jgi:rRNA processing protein Krr1/Pno1